MSSARKHHEQAERLLEQANTAGMDEASLHRILAEAQVHATLAVAAALGADSGGPAAAQPAAGGRTGLER